MGNDEPFPECDVDRLKADLAAHPDDRQAAERLAEALAHRMTFRQYPEETIDEAFTEDLARLESLLQTVPQPELGVLRALVAYHREGVEAASTILGQWLRQRLEGGNDLGWSEFSRTVRLRFLHAEPDLWAGMAEVLHECRAGTPMACFLAALVANDDGEALGWFVRCTDIDNTFAPAYQQAARIHLGARRWSAALRSLDACTAQAPVASAGFALWNRLACLHRLGRYTEEATGWQELLVQDAEADGAAQALGDSLFLLGHYDQALAWYERAMQQDAESHEPQWRRIETLRRLGHGSAAEAAVMQLVGKTGPASRATYLLTWNPKKTPRPEMGDWIAEGYAMGFLIADWSCGRSRRFRPGDRVYLHRQGLPPKGIVASGTVISQVWEGPHWDDEAADAGKTALYMDVDWEYVLDSEIQPPLALELLKERFGSVNWDTQVSGITIPPGLVPDLASLWAQHADSLGLLPFRAAASTQPCPVAPPRPATLIARIWSATGPDFSIEWAAPSLIYRSLEDGHPLEVAVIPGDDDWSRFWEAISAAHVWNWQQSYIDKRTKSTTRWTLSIALDDRILTTSGQGAYPGPTAEVVAVAEYTDTFTTLIEAISLLADGRRFF